MHRIFIYSYPYIVISIKGGYGSFTLTGSVACHFYTINEKNGEKGVIVMSIRGGILYGIGQFAAQNTP